MSKLLKKPDNTKIARIENFFIFNAKYSLTAKEQKVMLYLIAQINPSLQERFHEQIVPIKELQKLLIDKGKKNGSFYQEMEKFSDRIMDKRAYFDTEVELEGKRIPGRINFFQSISPIHNEKGEVCLEFLFSEKLKPFLLELKEYVSIDYQEVLLLKSGFSIRMYQIFRAHRDRMARHEKNSTLKYSVAELRSLLGVADKYEDWRNFKRIVLDKVKKEINKHTSIKMSFTTTREGRKVVGIIFNFSDRDGREAIGTTASNKPYLFGPKVEELSRAKFFAYQLLIAYGIKENIVLQMIAKVTNPEYYGFEDWYFEEVLHFFGTKTNQEDGPAKAGTLVTWFLKLQIFEQDDNQAKLMEIIQKRKKTFRLAHTDAWDNRMVAREMTAGEFRERFN
ncbi:MAG: replication initiation protein [Saprospiraceae bacterium]